MIEVSEIKFLFLGYTLEFTKKIKSSKQTRRIFPKLIPNLP